MAPLTAEAELAAEEEAAAAEMLQGGPSVFALSPVSCLEGGGAVVVVNASCWAVRCACRTSIRVKASVSNPSPPQRASLRPGIAHQQ